jgi:adenine phosphoribosyltransferase
MADTDALAAHFERLIRDIPDFPRPGIVFKDISPLLADHDGLTAVVNALAAAGADEEGEPLVDKVVGVEARGFILAAPVALRLGAGFVPVRKTGKLPGPVHQVAYALEYGQAVLEIHQDAIAPGERVLVIDDVLATGGTLVATKDLVESCGGVVAGVAVLMELSFLPGRAALDGLPLTVLHTV